MGDNESWFEDVTCKASLLDFVKSQTSLVNLNLSQAHLSSSKTTEVLSFLCQTSNVATLRDLDMQEAANFDSDEACEYLAQLIDSAKALKKIDISIQEGDRKVGVDLEYTVAADPADDTIVQNQGFIEVFEQYNVLCKRITQRTETNKVEISC